MSRPKKPRRRGPKGTLGYYLLGPPFPPKKHCPFEAFVIQVAFGDWYLVACLLGTDRLPYGYLIDPVTDGQITPPVTHGDLVELSASWPVWEVRPFPRIARVERGSTFDPLA